MMKQKNYLKRSDNTPTFKSVEKGLYPNAVLKITEWKYKKGEYLILNFQLYAHSPLEETPIKFRVAFDKSNIPEIFEGENILDVGVPTVTHATENYIDFDEDGVYLTNEYGKMWFILQSRITLPNGLGEINLSNWRFMTDEEINALAYA